MAFIFSESIWCRLISSTNNNIHNILETEKEIIKYSESLNTIKDFRDYIKRVFF